MTSQAASGKGGPSRSSAPPSPYPKINLAVGYEVIADWPRQREDLPIRYVTGVTVDAQDRVWMLSGRAPHVRTYTTEGELIRTWEGGEFRNPHHIVVGPDGDVWITDYGTHTVTRYSASGDPRMVLGTLGEAGADTEHFNRPTAAAITPEGDAFITDGYGNNRVVHVDPSGRFVKEWGSLGVGAGQLSQPHSISLDSNGLLYVGERNNCRIQIFDQDGTSLDQWRNLFNPWGTWITPDDEVYVCGSSPKRWGAHSNLGNPPTDQLVAKFSTDGRMRELWTFPLANPANPLPGTLDWVHAMAVDSNGDLYLGDVADDSPVHRIQKFRRLPAEA